MLGSGNRDTRFSSKNIQAAKPLRKGELFVPLWLSPWLLPVCPSREQNPSLQRLGGAPGATPCSFLFFNPNLLVPSYCCVKDMKMPRLQFCRYSFGLSLGKLLQNEKSLVSVSPNLRCTILSHFNISEIRCDWHQMYVCNMLVFLNSSFFSKSCFQSVG